MVKTDQLTSVEAYNNGFITGLSMGGIHVGGDGTHRIVDHTPTQAEIDSWDEDDVVLVYNPPSGQGKVLAPVVSSYIVKQLALAPDLGTFTLGPKLPAVNAPKFSRCFTLPNGVIYFAPYKRPSSTTTSYIGFYNPTDNQFTYRSVRGDYGQEFSGMIMKNGNVLGFVQYLGSSEPYVYNYSSDSFYRSTSSPIKGVESAGILAKDGKCYFTNKDVYSLAVYDPETDTFSMAGAVQEFGKLGGFERLDGWLVSIYTGDSGVEAATPTLYHPGTFSWKAQTDFKEITGEVRQFIALPNDDVILWCIKGSEICLYKWDSYIDGSNAVTKLIDVPNNVDVRASPVLLPNGKILFIAYNHVTIGIIYDPVTNTYEYGPEHNCGEAAFLYGTLTQDRTKVILCPWLGEYIGIYEL